MLLQFLGTVYMFYYLCAKMYRRTYSIKHNFIKSFTESRTVYCTAFKVKSVITRTAQRWFKIVSASDKFFEDETISERLSNSKY